MKKVAAVIVSGVITCSVCMLLSGGMAVGAEKSGEALFKQHCALCHANGGNIVNAQKTLNKKDREANGIKTATDIITTMRKPGPGMTKFDEKTVSKKEAHEIAEYILKTFWRSLPVSDGPGKTKPKKSWNDTLCLIFKRKREGRPDPGIAACTWRMSGRFSPGSGRASGSWPSVSLSNDSPFL
jgi:cytochrome c6